MGRACSTYWERRGVYRVWGRNLRERNHLRDPGLDGRIMLSWIFREWDVEVRTGSRWLRIGTGDWHYLML